MADTEKKETRGGDEVIKKSTVTPSEKKEPETYDYSKIKTGNNLGQVDKNKKPEAKTTTKTVEPKYDESEYQAYVKDFEDTEAKHQARHEEFVAEQKQKRQDIKDRANDPDFMKGVNPDERIAYAANLDLNYNKKGEVADTAWRDMNVNDFNNQKLQSTQNKGENREDVGASMLARAQDLLKRYWFAKRLNQEKRTDWKENVQKPENQKARDAAREINNAPFEAARNSYIEGVTDLSGNQLAELLLKNGNMSGRTKKLLQDIYDGNTAKYDTDPAMGSIIDKLNEMFDELREKSANDEYLTDAEGAVMAAVMPPEQAKFLKIGDRFKKYKDNEENALSSYMDAMRDYEKYMQDTDPTYGDDRHFVYDDGTVGIKGNGQSWLLQPETDELTTQQYLVLRDVISQLSGEDRTALRRSIMELTDDEKKELAAKLEGIDDPWQKKKEKDLFKAPKGWQFFKEAYVPTDGHPRARYRWDGSQEGLEDAIRQAKIQTFNDLRSGESQRGQRDYNTQRWQNERFSAFVANLLDGKDLSDTDLQKNIADKLIAAGANPDSLTPEKIMDTFVTIVNTPMSSVGTAERMHVPGKTDADFKAQQLYAVDSRDKTVRPYDQVPEKYRMLTNKEIQHKLGIAKQSASLYDDEGNLKKNAKQGSDGKIYVDLDRGKPKGVVSDRFANTGSGSFEIIDYANGNKKIIDRSHSAVNWGEKGNRELAKIEAEAKNLVMDHPDPVEQQQVLRELAIRAAAIKAQFMNNKEVTEQRVEREMKRLLPIAGLAGPKNEKWTAPDSITSALSKWTR